MEGKMGNRKQCSNSQESFYTKRKASKKQTQKTKQKKQTQEPISEGDYPFKRLKNPHY